MADIAQWISYSDDPQAFIMQMVVLCLSILVGLSKGVQFIIFSNLEKTINQILEHLPEKTLGCNVVLT